MAVLASLLLVLEGDLTHFAAEVQQRLRVIQPACLAATPSAGRP